MLCRKCVSSSLDYPVVALDRDGVCNLCTFYDLHRQELTDFERLKKEFDERIERIAKKGAAKEYDCVVAFSGGKDSTYILHYMKTRYRLRILAVTCDNYFMHPANLDKAVEVLKRLGVDSLYVKPPDEGLRRYFARSFVHTGSVCLGCVAFIWAATLGIAIERGIPAVLSGESRDQMFRGSYYYLLHAASPDDLSNLLTIGREGFYWERYYRPTFQLVRKEVGLYVPGDTQAEASVTISDDRLGKGEAAVPDIVPFFFFHPHNEREIVRELETHLGWKDLSGGKLLSHPDCVFHAIAYPSEVQNLIGHCIRENVLTRADAVREMCAKIAEWIDMDDRARIAEICATLGLGVEQVETKEWYKSRTALRSALRQVRDDCERGGAGPFGSGAPRSPVGTIGRTIKSTAARGLLRPVHRLRTYVVTTPRLKAALRMVLPDRIQSLGRRDSNERLAQRYRELLLEDRP